MPIVGGWAEDIVQIKRCSECLCPRSDAAGEARCYHPKLRGKQRFRIKLKGPLPPKCPLREGSLRLSMAGFNNRGMTKPIKLSQLTEKQIRMLELIARADGKGATYEDMGLATHQFKDMRSKNAVWRTVRALIKKCLVQYPSVKHRGPNCSSLLMTKQGWRTVELLLASGRISEVTLPEGFEEEEEEL